MEQHLRDYHTRRIIADIYPFDYNNHMYFITYPTPEFRYYAEKVYMDVYERAREENISVDNIIVLLDKYKLWSEEEENRLSTIKDELENTKVVLFENYFNDDKVPLYKKVIDDLRTEYARLIFKKQSMDNFTAEYTASLARQRFLVGSCILKPNKKRLWSRLSDWDKENNILNTAITVIMDNHLNEHDMRDLTKNDPWKTIWSLARRSTSIFHKSISNFSDEQQSICMWSIVYDNIRKSSEAPSESIINDDDALDGWMIIQRKKSEKNSDRKEVEQKIGNEKIARAGEIFIMANTPEQIKKVYQMNDFAGKIAFQKRMLQLQRDKFVDEVNMIETRERIIMEANNYYAQSIRR